MRILNFVMKLTPYFVTLFRGILLQNQNRFEEAILCYKDAIQYRPRLAGTSYLFCLPFQ